MLITYLLNDVLTDPRGNKDNNLQCSAHNLNYWIWKSHFISIETNCTYIFFQIPDLTDDEALIVPTAETVKHTFFLNLAMTHGMALGLSGPSGTGKSFLTNTYIRKLSKEKFITNVINFSARTSTNYTQDVIMSKLDRRRKGVFGPAMGKKCIIFVDDLNLPQQDDVGCIPAVELLRQVI